MSEDLIAHLRDLAADFGALDARRMFGGYGIYHGGLMIAVIIDDALGLKVDALNRERFVQAGSEPLIYTRQQKPVAMSFWSVPESAMDSAQEMAPWLRSAHEAALRKAKSASAKAGAVKSRPRPDRR